MATTAAAARLAGELDLLSRQLRADGDPETVLARFVEVALAEFPDQAESLVRRAATVMSAAEEDPSHPAALQRALAYIEANAHCALSVDDVARAAYLSPRALQLAFRRHLGTTPMAYLRRVRVERARIDLMTATPAHPVTVTEVAHRWGFPGASRFATLYRSATGEKPSQTLRRQASGEIS